MGEIGNLLDDTGRDALLGRLWARTAIAVLALAVPLLLHQPLELLIDPIQKIPVIHKMWCYRH